MIIHRITTKPYIHDLSGTGAMKYGGRWNPKGKRMLYTSGSLSLAMLEVLANSGVNQLTTGFYCTELEYPDDLDVETRKKWPEGWNTYPHSQVSMKMGAEFLEKGSCVLRVPSAIVDSEFNFLFNPLHDHFHQLRLKEVKPIIFDQRLWSR